MEEQVEASQAIPDRSIAGGDRRGFVTVVRRKGASTYVCLPPLKGASTYVCLPPSAAGPLADHGVGHGRIRWCRA